MVAVLSIITRTYGRRVGNLRSTFRSISSQDYRPIEWIVVEDGTSDAESVLGQLPACDGLEIRHVPIPKGGRSRAANAGLERATGDYVCFLDDDDEIFPSHASTLIGMLKRDSDASGAYAASVQTEFHGLSENGTPAHGEEQVFLTPTLNSVPLIWQNLFPIQAVVTRRRCAQQHRFDPNLDALEDWLFWLYVFLERKLIWSPSITSRFFVPPAGEDYEARMKAHSDAYRYFDTQRSAFLKARGLRNLKLLQQEYNLRFLRTLIQLGTSSNAAYSEATRI